MALTHNINLCSEALFVQAPAAAAARTQGASHKHQCVSAALKTSAKAQQLAVHLSRKHLFDMPSTFYPGLVASYAFLTCDAR